MNIVYRLKSINFMIAFILYFSSATVGSSCPVPDGNCGSCYRLRKILQDLPDLMI